MSVVRDAPTEPGGRGAWAAIATLAIVYAAAARLGLLMDAVSGFATLVWPATGIALFALLRCGVALWPGIFVGAFVVNVWTGAPPLVACGIAAGNTAEALIATVGLRRLTTLREVPAKLTDIVGLVLIAAIGSTLVSATIGTASLRVGGVIAGAHAFETWRAWWLGDMTGDLIVAPLLFAWTFDVRSSTRHAGRRALEAIALTVALLGAALIVLDTTRATNHAFTQSYMLFPLLIWASIRFGLRGATAATFAVSVVAIWGTAHGRGPFVHERLATSLLFLQLFMAVVSVTTLSLSVAIAERNRAIKSREWLLASVSHDLKNPLNMIGLSAAMLARLMPADNEALHRQVANIETASARMNALVRDLLDLSSIEAGHFSIEREPVETAALVDEAVAATRAVAAGRSQTLHAAIPGEGPSVVCDRRRIVQVLVNLIDNAIKFSPAKSEIKVTVEGDEVSVRFSVTDVGPGIAPSDARNVFQPFWRARNTSQPGSGIGLTIAKTIVDAHGGRIWVTTPADAGVGSRFSFSLPTAPRS